MKPAFYSLTKIMYVKQTIKNICEGMFSKYDHDLVNDYKCIQDLNVVILRPQPTTTFCFFAKILLQTRRMKTLRVTTCIYRSRRTNL